MKLKRVNPSVILVPEVRVTSRFSSEEMEVFQASIKEIGPIAPIIVCEVDGDLVLVDGKNRLEEAQKNGILLVDVAVFEGDMVDVLTKNLLLDHTRGKTPVSEMVKVIKTLYADFALDPDQIKARTGLTRDYIERLIKISTASVSVQEALDKEVIGVGHAFELSRLPHAIQQEEALAKLQIWRLPVKDLKEQVDLVLREIELMDQEPVNLEPPQPRPLAKYHCEGCKQEVELRELRPVMCCPDCWSRVWRLSRMVPTEKPEDKDEGGGP